MTELAIDTMIHMQKPHIYTSAPISVSENGRWIALTMDGLMPSVSFPGVSVTVAGKSLWICDVEHEGCFAVAPDATSSWSGVWSPVGNRLAFYSDLGGQAGLWVWEPTEGSKRLSRQVVRPFFGLETPVWTHDGRYVITKMMPSEEVDGAVFGIPLQELNVSRSVPSIQVYRTGDVKQTSDYQSPLQWINRYRAEIMRIDAVTGDATILAAGLNPFGISLSPDGDHVAILSAAGQEEAGVQQITYDLWIAPVIYSDSYGATCVAKGLRMIGPTFSWLDNETIILTTGGPLADGALWSVSICDASEPVCLVRHESVRFERDIEAPLVRPNGDILLLSAGAIWCFSQSDKELKKVSVNLERDIVAFQFCGGDTDSIVVQTWEPEQMLSGFYKLSLATGDTLPILEEPRRHYLWCSTCTDYTQKVMYVAESATEPPTPYMVDLKDCNVEKICEFNPEFAVEKTGEARLIQWELDGRTLGGALLLPKEIKGTVPVIVHVYGGAMLSQQLRSFGLSFYGDGYYNHLYTSRGYAVFRPDLPVSCTEPCDELTRGLEAAVNALASQPEIDVNRIGICGQSYGGYTALVGITRLNVFRTAVVSAAVADLISFSTHFEPTTIDGNYAMVEGGQYWMRDTLWNNPQRYINNSPLFNFDRVDVPVLIAQGTSDLLCSAQAGPIFSALRRLGKVAELVLYTGEDHFPGAWREENLKDFLERTIVWFDRYLMEPEIP